MCGVLLDEWVNGSYVELDSNIFEVINQLRSSKKQPNENTIFN